MLGDMQMPVSVISLDGERSERGRRASAVELLSSEGLSNNVSASSRLKTRRGVEGTTELGR